MKNMGGIIQVMYKVYC